MSDLETRVYQRRYKQILLSDVKHSRFGLTRPKSLLFPDEPRQVRIDAELTEVFCLKFILEWSKLMPYDLDFVLKFLGTLRRGHL